MKPTIRIRRVLIFFYHNPISGKWEFLRTNCVYCGKKVLIKTKNVGQNRYGDNYFYCENCLKQKKIVKDVLFLKAKYRKYINK